MEVDLKQLLTHTVGFLIMLWILRRFAWKPLLAMMEERRLRIVDEFKKIEDEKGKVAAQAAQYEAKLKEIDAERRVKLVEAVDEGRKLAADLKAQAQLEVRELHDKAKADLDRDVAKARVELRDQMVRMTMAATEKVIREKLDDTKHRDLITRYIAELDKV